MIRSEKGVSAVEFALIAPLLFVLTFGIVEFGLLLFDQAVITNASREGARAAIVYRGQDGDGKDIPPSQEEIEGVVADYTEDYLVNLGGDNSLVPPTIEYSDTPHGPWGPDPDEPFSGDYIRVTVNYTYDFLVFPDLTKLLGGSFDGWSQDLEGRTIMRME